MTNTDERSVKAEVKHSLYLTILISSHYCYELGILKIISFYPEARGILPHEVGQLGQSHTQACFRGSICHWLKISLIKMQNPLKEQKLSFSRHSAHQPSQNTWTNTYYYLFHPNYQLICDSTEI